MTSDMDPFGRIKIRVCYSIMSRFVVCQNLICNQLAKKPHVPYCSNRCEWEAWKQEFIVDKEFIGSVPFPIGDDSTLDQMVIESSIQTDLWKDFHKKCPICEDSSNKELQDIFIGKCWWCLAEKDLSERCKRSLVAMDTMNFPVLPQPMTTFGKKTPELTVLSSNLEESLFEETVDQTGMQSGLQLKKV